MNLRWRDEQLSNAQGDEIAFFQEKIAELKASLTRIDSQLAALPESDVQFEDPNFTLALEQAIREEQRSVAEILQPTPGEEAPPPALTNLAARKLGRRDGTPVDGQKLREYRGTLSQSRFAEKCDLGLDTVQRGEAGERWSETTFIKVSNRLSTASGKAITPDNLKKPQNT